MDQRQRRIAVAMKKRILELDQDTVWSDLVTLTGDESIIFGHERLLRSLHWGDADYEYCVSDVIESLIEKCPENLEIMLDYLDLPTRMKQNDPTEYAKLFGHSQILLEELSEAAVSTSFDVNQYILRIQDCIESDPELAIGSMKELLESVSKTVLVAHQVTLTGNEKFPKLLRKAHKELNLDPTELDQNAKGRDTIKRVLNSLGQVADGINELRGDYGTGHGRTGPSGVTPRHARLAVNAGAALAVFLIETFEHHKTSSN